MARIKFQKARKIWGCGKCRAEIPVGEQYYYTKIKTGPTSSLQIRRCQKCGRPRPSEMTSSDKLATLFGAQESMDDLIQAELNVEDLREGLEQAKADLEEVQGMYEESADNMEEYFQGSEQIDEIRERAEAVDGWHQELDDVSVAIDEYENALAQPQDNDDSRDQLEQAEEEVRDSVTNWTSNFPL